MPDLEMYRGNDRVFSLTITRADGSPVPLAGASLRFMARLSVSDTDADAVITKTTPTGITVTDASHGMVDVIIDSADTVSLYAPCTLIYDVELKEGSNYVSTAAHGVLLVKRTMIPV